MLKKHRIELDELIKEDSIQKENKLNDITELLIYKELFERLCLVIEDFSIIFNALSLELSEFHRNILHQPKVESIIKNIDKNSIYKVLKYDDLSYMTNDDKSIIEEIRNNSVDIVLEIKRYIEKFLEHNWLIYTKLKHGNTVIYNYNKIVLDGINTYVLPVMYNTKEPKKTKPLILNYNIYLKMQLLFDSILILTKSFCDTNYNYICSCETENILGEIYTDTMDENMIKKVKDILKKYPKGTSYYNISLQVKFESELEKLKNIIDMYKEMKVVICLDSGF